jgi:hypothetical protein
MANVGNLFINVTGNTKGLTKALSSAKTKLATFDKQVGRPRGDFMRRARGRFQGAMAERQRFSERMSSFIGPQPAGYVEKMQARLGKQEKSARQGYRQAQREQVMGGMRRQAQMTLGIIGVSIAGATMVMKKAMSISESAREGMEKFRLLGPQGSEIIRSEIKTLLQSMEGAQDPAMSAARARRARASQGAEAAAIEGGFPIMTENAKALGFSILESLFQSSTTFKRKDEMFFGPLFGPRIIEGTIRNFMGGY